jgi:hypothetical protein
MLSNLANLETENQNERMAQAVRLSSIAATMGRKTRCGTAYEAVSRERW